ncbi:hypothetical protein BDN72DRAFT_949505 [Pluteus cervinus]|uniref:Uncharacterized protein n=1 Tax=Pluteus cervinus TaxID=181527 RepID=A0ACD3ASM5_9AGAR|nr:hypothetical protein BDN72DRAFT_949505 [Pluteus cervinus]
MEVIEFSCLFSFHWQLNSSRAEQGTGIVLRNGRNMTAKKRSTFPHLVWQPRNVFVHLLIATAMATIFPAEIVHEFLLHINEDNERKKTLLSCSLVSQAWRTIAQPYFYSRVALILDRHTTKAKYLPIALVKSPRIRTYVHHLSVSILNTPPKRAPLHRFPSLQSLQIYSGVDGRRVLNLDLTTNIHPFLSSKVLTSLSFSDLWHVPIRLFRHCVALEKLSLRRVTVIMPKSDAEDEDCVPGCHVGERPYLKSLVLSTREQEDSRILDAFLSAFSPVNLSRFETFMGLDRSNEIRSYDDHCNFISHVSNTLKNISIDPPTTCLRDPLVLLKPHELRKISHITLAVVQDPTPDLDALPWAIAFLSGLPNSETLQALTLLCDLEGHTNNDFAFHSRGWSELDTLLTRFCNLQRVDLKFYDEPNDDVARELVSWIRSQLPTLSGRGILFVEYSYGMLSSFWASNEEGIGGNEWIHKYFVFIVEIIQEFMLHINGDEERMETLLSCSLVSQIWCAMPYLYRRVVLNMTKTSTLVGALSKTPHIRTYVHRLLLILPWNTTIPSVSVSALGDLPSLQSLLIRSSSVNNYKITSNREFEQSLQPLLNLRSLTSLAISDLDAMPMEILRQCVALRNLALFRVMFTTSESGSDANAGEIRYQPEGRPVLKSLVVSTWYADERNILNVFLSSRSPVDVSQLETFLGITWNNNAESYEDNCNFISHISGTLRTVLIDPPPSRLPSPDTLQEVTLFCDLASHDDGDFTFHSRGWSELDALLSRFQNLRRVHLKCYDERYEPAVKQLVSWISSQCLNLDDKDLTYTDILEHELVGWHAV